jgi:hypothetical protein
VATTPKLRHCAQECLSRNAISERCVYVVQRNSATMLSAGSAGVVVKAQLMDLGCR